MLCVLTRTSASERTTPEECVLQVCIGCTHIHERLFVLRMGIAHFIAAIDSIEPNFTVHFVAFSQIYSVEKVSKRLQIFFCSGNENMSIEEPNAGHEDYLDRIDVFFCKCELSRTWNPRNTQHSIRTATFKYAKICWHALIGRGIEC